MKDLSQGFAVLSTILRDLKDLALEVKGTALHTWKVFHGHPHPRALQPILCTIHIPTARINATPSHKPCTTILDQSLILILQTQFIRLLRLYQIPTCTNRTVMLLIVTLNRKRQPFATQICLTTPL